MIALSRAVLAALLVLGAEQAQAQITTVIGGPKRTNAAAQQQAAKVQQAAEDSVARVTLTGMTQWVDSAAAALALRPDTGTTSAADTAIAVQRPAQPRADTVSRAAQQRDTSPAFRNGARAPNTATPLPTIALLGVLLIVVGLVMRRDPRMVRARRQ